jgi:16S rRNA (cytidine1402-2'-O)-methyltransferase
MDGILWVAATPIGHAQDASLRLRNAMETADIIAAEDTRKAKFLMNALGVISKAKVISFFAANESARVVEILDSVSQGSNVLMITDAGMPGVSDPGYSLVSAAIVRGITPVVLPGPSAVTTALTLSGLPMERFIFDGFISRTDGARREYFKAITHEERTVVLFESPRRLASSLEVAAELLGGHRLGAICREMTKTYEETIHGTIAELAAWANSHEVLGEITLVIAPAPAADRPTDEQILLQAQELISLGMGKREATAELAQELGIPKRDIYDLLIASPKAD